MGLSPALTGYPEDLDGDWLAALSDQHLLGAIRETPAHHRDEAFDEIVRRYEPRVRAWCVRLTRDRENARDLAQDVFLRAYVSIQSFRGDSQLSTWLYTIARNHCLNNLKRQSAATIEIGDALSARLRDSHAQRLYDEVEERQIFNFLWAIVKPALNPLEMRVLEMHYGHEISLNEITRRLSLSNPAGAKAFIVNARRKITALRRRNPALKR